MKFCTSTLCILLSLTITTATPKVKVKLQDSAVLSCSERCSGLVRWTIHHKPDDPLAECDRTSCRSVKEGYQMIHDQYLKGDFSLTITDADFSKRGYYTCDCDHRDICNVNLLMEALKTAVQMKSGETLVLKLVISDPVDVIYNSSGAAYRTSGQICTVDTSSVQFRPEYAQRLSLSSFLELRGMKESDSGVYTIQDIRNQEDIHIYTVRVQDADPDLGRDEGGGVPVWIVAVMLVAAVAVIVVLLWFNVQQRREIQKLQTRSERNRVDMQSEVLRNGLANHNTEEETLSDI